MANLGEFCLTVLLVSLSLTATLSVNSPLADSRSLAAEPAVEPTPPDSPPTSPSESPMSSPPSPPPSEISPTPAPAESPSPPSPSPSSMPNEVSEIIKGSNAEESSGSKGGLSGGKKAGIALGVIATAFLVGLGGIAYKKRQDNIRRSQFGYAARRELL